MTKERLKIVNEGKVIMITSGKGGVGKSTISSLLSSSLSSYGLNIGLVDIDLYGPSIPHIFDIEEIPEIVDKRMLPICKYGVYINSLGLIASKDSAISWRGPIANKVIYQLLMLTRWPELDYLIIDTPPGTGDIHLSILQNYHIDDVILITLPEALSKIDVRRSIDLYRKFDVNIKGYIENQCVLGEQGDCDHSLGIEKIGGIEYSEELRRLSNEGKDLTKLSRLMNKILNKFF